MLKTCHSLEEQFWSKSSENDDETLNEEGQSKHSNLNGISLFLFVSFSIQNFRRTLTLNWSKHICCAEVKAFATDGRFTYICRFSIYSSISWWTLMPNIYKLCIIFVCSFIEGLLAIKNLQGSSVVHLMVSSRLVIW